MERVLPATDTVQIRVYDQPVANAGMDIDLCNLYDTNLGAVAPVGTATGMWTEDVTHTQPSSVSFADATQFNSNVSNLQEGTYRLVWTVSNGTCIPSTDIVELRVYDQPIADAGAAITICDIGEVELIGNPAVGTATGQWSLNNAHPNPSNINFVNPFNHQTQASYILEGEYQFVWTLNNGTCPSSTDTVSVLRFPRPTANFFQIEDELCTYECLTLTDASIALPPYSIANVSWTIDLNSFAPFSTLDEPTLCIEVPGTYDLGLIATSSNGCTDTITVEDAFTVHPSPVALFSYTPDVVDELELVNITDESSGASSVVYDLGDGNTSNVRNPEHIYEFTGDYTITQFVENNEGCVDTSYQTISINEKENVFIPNGFTPDGNGHNDIFLPRTRGIDVTISEYRLIIFDRWGKIIFESQDLEEGWNGTSKGIDMPVGVYVWQITYKSGVGEESKTERGHVTLVR